MEENMDQLAIYQAPETPYLSEQRINDRQEMINLLAITERGTGQILDINREGLSFGCLYPHTFPHEFYLDIIDAKGSHIKKLKVRKMWEINGDYQQGAAIYELMVGLEFPELTSTQADAINFLLDNIELAEYPSPDLV